MSFQRNCGLVGSEFCPVGHKDDALADVVAGGVATSAYVDVRVVAGQIAVGAKANILSGKDLDDRRGAAAGKKKPWFYETFKLLKADASELDENGVSRVSAVPLTLEGSRAGDPIARPDVEV